QPSITSDPFSGAPRPERRPRRRLAALIAALAAATVLVGCTDDPDPAAVDDGDRAAACTPDEVPDAVEASDVADADTEGVTIRLVTHDSFALSDGVFYEFTADTGIEVEQLTNGDTGTLVSQSILTAGDPVADVMFGIDTTFLCRGT